MANNYTLFSIGFSVTPEQAAWLEEVFAALDGEGTPPEGFTRLVCILTGVEGENPEDCTTHRHEVEELYSPCEIEIEDENEEEDEGKTAYLYADESGDLDTLTVVLQQYLQHFDINEGIGIEAAFTCSKPRVGEFGGAAAWVTKDSVEWMSTSTWLSSKQTGQ